MQADDTPEDRLEAALARIARAVETPDGASAYTEPARTEIAERLDRMIATVRAALGDPVKA